MSASGLALLLAAFDLGGLAGGAALLWGHPAIRRARWPATLAALAVLGGALATLAFVLGVALDGHFLVLRLWCHALFCVLAPLALVRGALRRGPVGWAVVALALGAEGAYLWARHVEPYRLEVRRHELAVPGRPEELGRLRVVVLADLQTDAIGDFERRVLAAADAERPDLLLVPGDLIQPARGRYDEVRAEVTELFLGLEHVPPLGILMVEGDCEPRGVTFEGAGIRMIDGEVVPLAEHGVQVLGLGRLASRERIAPDLVRAARAFEGLTIVMGHAPEFALSTAEVGAPVLSVAGHTHGGQVTVPLLGPVITLSRVPRRIAAGGFFELGDDAWLCLSRGIGMERMAAPRIRFLCRPELVVIDLVPDGHAAR